jgi:hypothetical protein
MKSFLLSIVNSIGKQNLLKWIFPDIYAAYQTWLAGKNEQNAVALAEVVGNDIITAVDPTLLPEVENVEHEAAPLVTAVDSLIETPTVQAGELVLTEAIALVLSQLKLTATEENIAQGLQFILGAASGAVGATGTPSAS